MQTLAGAGSSSSRVVAGGFIAPFVCGLTASLWIFDLPMLTALFIGGTLTATCIGVTVQVLRDPNRHKSPEAQVVPGGIKVNDGKVLIFIAIFIAIFMALAPLVAKIMAETIGHDEQLIKIQGLIPATIVTLGLFFAWVAHAVAAPALLGGFNAGLALSRRLFLRFGASLVRADGDVDALHDIAITTVLPPFILKWFYARYGERLPAGSDG